MNRDESIVVENKLFMKNIFDKLLQMYVYKFTGKRAYLSRKVYFEWNSI